MGRKMKHGMSNTRLHRIWRQMRQRCNNPNDNAYKNYGGKGVTVCQEWDTSFIAFMNWAMTHGYQEGLTIDRKDSNGNYCPENCEWVTRAENCRRAMLGKESSRKKGAKKYTYNGKTMVISDWAKELGVTPQTIYDRLKRMTVEEALYK